MLTLALVVALSAGDKPATAPAPDKKDAPKAADPKAKDTAKGLLKDDGPDVSKMPFTPDSIKQVVAANQAKIQECYEETLRDKNKAPEGVLKTSWQIDADGYVKNAKVDKKKSTLKEPKLHDCVVGVITAMVFPKPPDGKPQPIEYPFNLKAVH
jgi:hypothetical protein